MAEPSPTALELLELKRNKIASELDAAEKHIYLEETDYFTQDYSSFGNVLKGFEGFLTSKNAQTKNKNRNFWLKDRAFSLSSYTSPAMREAMEEREREAVEPVGLGRTKGGYGVKGADGVAPAKQSRY